MWLIHQFDSLLNLGICKEYPIMAKAKTPRNSTEKTNGGMVAKLAATRTIGYRPSAKSWAATPHNANNPLNPKAPFPGWMALSGEGASNANRASSMPLGTSEVHGHVRSA